MLCVSCPKCDKRVPLYLLEEHHLKHEEEDREYMQMVANIQVIRVKKRVPAEKVRDQQDGEVHGEGQRGQPAEEVKEHTIDMAEEEEEDKTREEEEEGLVVVAISTDQQSRDFFRTTKISLQTWISCAEMFRKITSSSESILGTSVFCTHW